MFLYDFETIKILQIYKDIVFIESNTFILNTMELIICTLQMIVMTFSKCESMKIYNWIDEYSRIFST